MTIRDGTDGDGLYLYAILQAEVCSNEWTRELPDGLHLIRQGPFAALVRRATEGALTGRNREELARRLIAHQQVVERIMATAPLLPVKFATVAPDRESVERCLDNGRADFAVAFEHLQGKTQFEILVTWNLEAVFAEIAADPEVARLKTELAAMAEGPTPDVAARLGALVKGKLDDRRGELGASLSKALRDVAIDTIVNPLMDDRMVLNLAMLVDKDDGGRLDRCLESLDAAHEENLTFRCIGPLPPHSFATVEVAFLDDGKIASAREVLELDTVQDAGSVRAAYRRLVKQAHPDLAGVCDDNARITALREAYDTLRSVVDAGDPVTVSVRRQEAVHAAEAG